jgi:hypothetical protein
MRSSRKTLTAGGYADGTAEMPAVSDAESLRDLAAQLRQTLQSMGVEVDDGEIPVLRHDGKYVDLR